MADTQKAPALEEAPGEDSSVFDAQQALLAMLESEEKRAAEGSDPSEEELSSTDEDRDESSEEVSDDDLEDDESEEEVEEESDEYEEDDPVYAVKVDGEEIEVSLDELLKGYSRNSSFTKKSQALAEEKRQMEALQQQYNQDLAQIQAERQQYAQQLQSVIERSNLSQFANIDWERLRTEDPIEFVTKREEFREAQEGIARLQQEQQAAMQKAEAANQKQWEQSVRSEHAALVEKMPEWGDPGKQKKLASELRSYAASVGFQQEEIESLIDHRSFIVLNKARLYDEMQKANPKAKKLKNKPKVIRGGKAKASQSAEKSKRNSLRNRLKETGNVRDAAVLFEDFVDI